MKFQVEEILLTMKNCKKPLKKKKLCPIKDVVGADGVKG